MRVFVAHSKDPDRDLANEVAVKLRVGGFKVFFDEDSLPLAHGYDSRIRKAIGASDVFVFIASKTSTQAGHYALTELGIAKKRWPNPAGRVLAVVIGDLDFPNLDPYLRSGTTALRPKGDAATEIAGAVVELAARRRRLQVLPLLLGLALVSSLPIVAVRAWKSAGAVIPPRTSDASVDGRLVIPAVRDAGPNRDAARMSPDAASDARRDVRHWGPRKRRDGGASGGATGTVRARSEEIAAAIANAEKEKFEECSVGLQDRVLKRQECFDKWTRIIKELEKQHEESLATVPGK